MTLFLLWLALAESVSGKPATSDVHALVFVAAANDIAGKWRFVMETDDGPRELDAEFEQTGDQVTGRWGESKVQGTFADGKLKLAFPVQSPEAGAGTLTLTGSLEAEGLKGNWTFQTYGGTFKAKRKE